MRGNPLLIRPVQPTDAAEWLRMRMALPFFWAAFVCQQEDGSLCGLAEGAIQSKASGCTTGRIGYLEAWYVDPAVRRQGAGRASLGYIEVQRYFRKEL